MMSEIKVRQRCWELCGYRLGSCIQRGVNPAECEVYNGEKVHRGDSKVHLS